MAASESRELVLPTHCGRRVVASSLLVFDYTKLWLAAIDLAEDMTFTYDLLVRVLQAGMVHRYAWRQLTARWATEQTF